tara:strand:+ start:190 stop:411 length:222 start_codon:yes stop_codon:yes gene_type:complete
MPPEMYYSLKSVRGFSNLNGDTYKEHILIIFKEFLTEKDRKRVIGSSSDEKALKSLPFEITHEYQENNESCSS